MFSEQTKLSQIELKAEKDGNIAYAFIETIYTIFKDGEEVSSTYHRAALDASSPEAQAALGDALAGALATVDQLRAELAAALQQIATLTAPDGAA